MVGFFRSTTRPTRQPPVNGGYGWLVFSFEKTYKTTPTTPKVYRVLKRVLNA